MTTAGKQMMSFEEVDLLSIFVCLLRGKRTVLLYVLWSLAIGVAVSLLWPTTYRSTTEVLPPQQRASGISSMMNEVSAGAAALATAGTELQARSAAETYVHMLQAQPVLDGVIDQFQLMQLYHRKYKTDTRKKLLACTSISVSKEGFVSLTVEDRDRDRAAAMANSYVEQMRVLSRRLLLTESSQRRFFYECQLEKVKEELSQAEVAFKSMQQNSQVISLDAQAKTMIEGAAQLRAQLATKQVELERLRGFATSNNPQVQGIEDELRGLRTELARVEASGGGGYSGMSLSRVPAAELKFVRATREMRYQESVYDLLMKQYEMARMDEARDAPNVQVLQTAMPSERPAWPIKSVVVGLSGLMGMIAGCTKVIGAAWRDNLTAENAAKLREVQGALLGWLA